ncbi:MAG TPA: M28 family peptidase [Candidatus Sulfotelmatobacter sp.]|nr:M28 family peptidase [Candidatus Sulfotelmatobacter sp.]
MRNLLQRHRALVALAAVVLFTAAASTPVPQADPARYLDDIKSLAAPEMEGRGAGTKGIARAEHLIEKRYKELKLDPAGVHGYARPFTVITGARLKSDNHLKVETGGSAKDLKISEDFVPFSFSSSGQVDAPVVFAGYGVTAEEFHYDDYAGLDVRDKVVVILRYEPSGFAAKSADHGLTQHSQLVTKAINARNHGAKAVVVVNGKLGDGEEDLLTRFGSVSGPKDAGIVLVQVKNAVADSWFQAAGKSLGTSLKEVQDQINSTSKPASFAFPESIHISIHVDVETTHAVVNNVLAYLPGQTDEYVIIGAHYDHLGRGNFDSLAPSQIGQIHPGADDNASGTAGVLELARLLAPQRGELKRGILFMNFAGEELGLLGSAEWVKEPTRPIEKAVAMINMDMIGRIKDDKVYIGGVGTGSTLKSILEQAQKNQAEKGANFKIEYSASGFSSSDHTSFVGKKIPVLFFFSGLHSDYHKPSDTWDKINAPSAARLLDMVGDVAVQLASTETAPLFQTVVEDKPAAGGGGGGYGPYFGSIPDFGQTENGVKFSDVKPGSPAAKAGLKAGDVLVQFGDKPIKNLYDFTDALRRSKVGDVVEVKVLRDGQPVNASVKLEQRK